MNNNEQGPSEKTGKRAMVPSVAKIATALTVFGSRVAVSAQSFSAVSENSIALIGGQSQTLSVERI